MSTNTPAHTGHVTGHRSQTATETRQLPRPADPAAQRYDDLAVDGADNSARAYAADLRSYEAFCRERQLSPYPAEADTLTSYIAALADKKRKLATINRHLASIQKRHRESGLTSAVGTPPVNRVLKGVAKALGKKQKQAPAFTVEHLKSCIEQLDLSTPNGVRDRALLLLGFAGAFRRSELVGVNIEHLKIRGNTLFISMGRTKTNQEKEAQEKAFFLAENPLFCPIRAYQDWAAQLGRKKGPLFVSIRRGSKAGAGVPTTKRLSTNSVNTLVGRHLGEFEEGVPYTAHSFRSSFITAARLAGQSNEYIKNQTNHKSDLMLQRYTRLTNVETHNAGRAIGL